MRAEEAEEEERAECRGLTDDNDLATEQRGRRLQHSTGRHSDRLAYRSSQRRSPSLRQPLHHSAVLRPC